MYDFKVVSKNKNEMIDITEEIKDIVVKSGITDGFAVVYVPHTTAGVTINEGADPSVKRDIIHLLAKIIPENGNYHHLEGNSDAHIKASLIGSSINILIDDKKLVLGPWQHVFFYEGDGPRNRHVYVDVFKK